MVKIVIVTFLMVLAQNESRHHEREQDEESTDGAAHDIYQVYINPVEGFLMIILHVQFNGQVNVELVQNKKQ